MPDAAAKTGETFLADRTEALSEVDGISPAAKFNLQSSDTIGAEGDSGTTESVVAPRHLKPYMKVLARTLSRPVVRSNYLHYSFGPPLIIGTETNEFQLINKWLDNSVAGLTPPGASSGGNP